MHSLSRTPHIHGRTRTFAESLAGMAAGLFAQALRRIARAHARGIVAGLGPEQLRDAGISPGDRATIEVDAQMMRRLMTMR